MKRSFLALFISIFCISASAQDAEKVDSESEEKAELPSRPNVVLIMCDDLGWGDVGYNGNEIIQTPHLDEMSRNSLRFNRFYAAAPVCSPTRGSVITGRHPFRYGIYSANKGRMKEEEFTLYEALKTKGYRTGHFGKWHLGTLTTQTKDANRGNPGNIKDYSAPWHHEVDQCFVTESKVPTYDPMYYPTGRGSKRLGWFALKPGEAKQFYGTYYWEGENKPVPIDDPRLKGDNSKVIMDAALPFMEESVEAEKPFLSIIWFHAPHLPVVAGPEHTKLYSQYTEFEANYYGCITALDEQVGRLRKALREWKVEENTMVFFCSDNGPEGNIRDPGSAGPYRGRKRSLYEGGIRVPGMLEWPAKLRSGQTDFPTGTIDYFPTILAAAGFPPDSLRRPMDGIDLNPLFEEKMHERPMPLAFQDEFQGVISDNRYKAYVTKRTGIWELYDLIDDPGETKNLASRMPNLVATMSQAWESWVKNCANSDRGADYK